MKELGESMSKRTPMYLKIFEDYKARIISGELKPNDRLPSETELSSNYNVSRITTKRSMEELMRAGLIYRRQGSGTFVSKKMTVGKRDMETMNSKGICGLCIPFGSPLGRSVDLIRGTSDYLRRKGYLLSVQISDFDANKEREILRDFFGHGVLGLIIYPLFDRVNLDVLNELSLDNMPIVTVDKYIDGLPIRSVVSDNYNGAKAAVDYLIEKGHKNIGFLSDLALADSPTVRDRYFGYCKAHREMGLQERNENCRIGFIRDIERMAPESTDVLRFKKPISPYIASYFQAILNDMLDRQQNPVTAIFCINDYIAIMLMKCALEAGVRIPEQLSIMGYDNIELAIHLDIPLTTVEQNFYQMGSEAARQLVRQITGSESAKGDLLTILPVRIIERASVADLKKNQKINIDSATFPSIDLSRIKTN